MEYYYKKTDEKGETTTLYELYNNDNAVGLTSLTRGEYDMETDAVKEHVATVKACIEQVRSGEIPLEAVADGYREEVTQAIERDRILDYIAEVKSGELKIEDVPEQYQEEVENALASDPEQAAVQTILREVSKHDY